MLPNQQRQSTEGISELPYHGSCGMQMTWLW